jgi:multidrug resistance protein
VRPESTEVTAQTATGHQPVAVWRGVAVAVGGLTVLLAAIDAYVVVSIFQTILNELGLPINHLERATPIVTGYLLGYVAGMPLLARVSDRYGRRLVIYAGLAGFTAGSAITALSHTENWLVIGRTVQGVAGGALLPVTLALAADLFAERNRARILGGVGAAQELGSVVGPLYGALIALHFGWRWAFWINIPLSVLAAMLVHKAVPSRKALHDATGITERPRVDVTGGLLLAGALASAVIALNNQHPELSVLAPHGRLWLAAAGTLFVLFIVWEMVAKTKLMEMAGVKKRPFFASIVTSVAAGASLLVTLVFVQLDAQNVLGKTALQASLLLVRFLIALPLGALVGGFLVRRFGERLVTVAGLLLATYGYWLISRWPVQVLQAHHHVFGLRVPMLDADLILCGFGLGLVIAPLSAAVLRAVPEESHGIASAALVVARMMGMLIGVAALAAWGLHKYNVLVRDVQLPLGPFANDAEAKAALDAFNAANNRVLAEEFHSIFRVITAICVAGVLLALTLEGRRRSADVEEVAAA